MIRNVAAALVFVVSLAVAPAAFAAGGWVYVESNNPERNRNSVLALEYGKNGSLNPISVREFRTGGAGGRFIPDQSTGVLAGDQEITLSPDKRFLFAVNQGSDTVAVFRVNRRTGALRAVKGSPFRSGGKAPISVGFNGRHLVVVNHGTVAPFAPGPGADFGDPNFTSFSVSRQGRLRKVNTVPAGPGPSQAHIPASGRNVFSTSFYAFAGPENDTIQSLTLSSRGRLAEAAGSPTGFPESMTRLDAPLPPFLPPGIEKLAFGIASHPTRPYVYILGTASNRVAIYRFSRSGALTFVGQEDNTGSFAACWVVLTGDGRYMYTANTVTQDISFFRVSRDGSNLTFVEKVPLPSTATPFNIAVDPDDRTLYVVGGHDDPDGPRPQQLNPDGSVNPQRMPADGNFIESYRIGRNGRPKSLGTTALPVRRSVLPYGLVVVERASGR